MAPLQVDETLMTAVAACLAAPSQDQGALAAMNDQVVEDLFQPTLAAVQQLGPHLQGSARDRQVQAQAVAEVQRGLQRLKALLSYSSTWLGQAALTAAASAQPAYPSLGQCCTRVSSSVPAAADLMVAMLQNVVTAL